MTMELRPDPPPELRGSAAEVWRRTVEALPSGWFGGETLPLLELYCQHVVMAQQLIQLACADPANGELLDAANRASRVVKDLAVQLRLTPKMRHELLLHGGTAHARRTDVVRPNVEHPWQDDDPATSH